MMVGEDDKKQRNLTFSQREGKAPLPEALQTGKLTTKFRNRVWYVIANNIEEHECSREYEGLEKCEYIEIGVEPSYWGFNELKAGIFWQKFYPLYCFNILETPHDEIENKGPKELKTWLKDLTSQGESHELITLLEYMLRLSTIPKKLANDIVACFALAPYLIDRSSRPIYIIPATSEEMKENIKRALANINPSELTGVKQHLGNATQELNNNNFAASIRESIYAVESVTRQIDPKKSENFKDALNSLEKSGMLKHKALKEAFNKLYGYTSNEQGIRHALIDTDTANVGLAEAIFMYGACVSFIDYLASKKTQMKTP